MKRYVVVYIYTVLDEILSNIVGFIAFKNMYNQLLAE